ncbi:hypothetical protein HYU14_03410 [Candidatus Woesearchaeota archaeon]|nr:hypothetical protein [Candidatus Woesearchaeota archaeon]
MDQSGHKLIRLAGFIYNKVVIIDTINLRARQISLAAFFIFFFLSFPLVQSHSNILYNIDLEFDKTMEEGVTKAAQKFLGVREMPKSFDYDFELISVKFDRMLELSALVDPSDFSIMGFRDDSRVSERGEEKFPEGERRKIAEKVFQALPKAYREELFYSGEKKLYQGTYQHSWFRKINGIAVMNEHFTVEVDPADGEVAAWRMSLFATPKEKILTEPAISFTVAQKIAELGVGGKGIGILPVLVINKDRPLWLAKIKNLYPIFAAVDAADGHIVFSGNARTELPEGYDFGREVPVKETAFIKEIYE